MSRDTASPMRGSRHWQLLFLLTGMVTVITVIVAAYSLSRVSQTYDTMERALQFVVSIRATHSAIQAVEISERDYLLWDNEQSLQIYRDSVGIVVSEMRKIQSWGSDIPVFEQVLQLESLLSQRLRVDSIDQLDFPFAGIPPPKENWSLLENAELLRNIRTTVKGLEESYAELLAAQRVEITNSENAISLALIVVSTLGALGMLFIYRLLNGSLKQQARWESELLQQKAVLEDRVAARTAALQQNSLELERSNRELEDFAFVASHDLQEPLRKIQAFGDRLRGSCAEALGDKVDYLDRMQSAAARMSTLIQDLLEFSRVTSKPRAFETVSMDAVLAEVLESLEVAITGSNAVVQADPLPDIEADRTQMHQLLQNLIGNAIKFVAEQDTPQIRITANRVAAPNALTLTDPGEFLEMHVIDNGIGFDMDYLERIFKPFQRLHSRSQYSGTGIGLALCLRIVERHKGSLTASSKKGCGADFTVLLPLKYDDSEDDLTVELEQERDNHG